MTPDMMQAALAGWTARPFGPAGLTADKGVRRIIITDDTLDGVVWRHASISRTDKMPTYQDLQLLHQAGWGSAGHAYQVFVPPGEHVNIHDRCLHLWGRADGTRALPDFTSGTGQI